MELVKFINTINNVIDLVSSGATTISNKKIKEGAEKWIADYSTDLFTVLTSYPKAIKSLKYLTKSVNNQRLLKKKWLKNLRVIKKSLNYLKFSDKKEILIFNPNKPFTAYQILKGLFNKAKKEIFVFDGYVEEGTLDILADISDKVKLKILTNNTYGKFLRELPRFKREFSSCEVRKSSIVHDRFFIIDDKCFIAGTSLHAIGGRKSSCIFEINKEVGEILKNQFHIIWNQSSKM